MKFNKKIALLFIIILVIAGTLIQIHQALAIGFDAMNFTNSNNPQVMSMSTTAYGGESTEPCPDNSMERNQLEYQLTPVADYSISGSPGSGINISGTASLVKVKDGQDICTPDPAQPWIYDISVNNIDVSSWPAGTYSFCLTINATGGSPLTFSRCDNFTISRPAPTTGTVCEVSNVTTSGTLSGANNYSVNPIPTTTTCQSGEPTGDYTIVGTSLGGYTGPTYSPSQTQTLTGGGTITFTLTYTAGSGGSVTCSPSNQSVQVNSYASLNASGGNGSFSWSAPGGSPGSGNGSTFSTEYPSAGTNTVTVTSNGSSASCTVVVSSGPTCTGTSMQYNLTQRTSGTLYAYAQGVQNATSMYFPTWGIVNGQNDLVWYPGSNNGGGNWSAAINLANHNYNGSPEYGAFETDVYMNNSSYTNVSCAGMGWTRDQIAVGYVDTTNVSPANSCVLGGWAYDPDTSSNEETVYLYSGPVDGGTLQDAFWTTGYRPDVNAAFGITGNHGWTLDNTTLPAVFLDGGTHSGYLYAIDTATTDSHTDPTFVNKMIGSFTVSGCYPPPTASLTPSSSTINWNSSQTLTYSCTNSSTASLQDTTTGTWLFQNSATVSGNASTGNLTSSQNYTLTCNGKVSGTATAAATVNVNARPAPTVTITANPAGPLAWNNSGTTISWSSTNADSCQATSNWPGTNISNGTSLAISDSKSTSALSPGSSNTYSISCAGNGAATGSVTVTVAYSAPSVSNATETDPNYCVSGPGGTISWTYSDPANSPQSAYQVQVTATGNFNNPMYDSGKVLSSSKVFSIPAGTLAFNTTYKAQVRVWNAYDIVSAWSGPTNSWKTPPYAYPQVSFTYSPTPPQKGVQLQFTDQTVFGGGNANNRSWAWTFGDNSTSTAQNPTHTYANTGVYTVTLTATDAAGQTCGPAQGAPGATQILNVQKPIPSVKEVAPK